MKKVFTTIALALALVLTVPVAIPQTVVVAEAATKTAAYVDCNEIGVNATTQIYLDNKKSKASYTFSSSKKSVATVSKKGVITGKKTGTVKITVTQKYKGKTTKVGTVKITVKKAEIPEYLADEDNEVWVSAQPGWISEENPMEVYVSQYVYCMNPKAKYTFYSDSTDLVISKDGMVTEVKKSGKAHYIIKETYKGKTRTVGKVPVQMMDPKYIGADTVELCVGDDVFYLKDYIMALGNYNFSWSDTKQSVEEAIQSANDPDQSDEDEVLAINVESDGSWYGGIKAKAQGTRYCTITQYNYLTGKYDKVVAQFTIVVPDTSKLTDLKMPWEQEDSRWDSYNSATNTVEMSYYEEYSEIWMEPTPYKYSGSYEVTSSNPDVVSAKIKTDEWGGQYLTLEYLKAGTSTITIRAGEFQKSFIIKVVDKE